MSDIWKEWKRNEIWIFRFFSCLEISMMRKFLSKILIFLFQVIIIVQSLHSHFRAGRNVDTMTKKTLLNRDEKLSRILDAFVDMTSNRTLTFIHSLSSWLATLENEFLYNAFVAAVAVLLCYKKQRTSNYW